jgi:hypothetical protein
VVLLITRSSLKTTSDSRDNRVTVLLSLKEGQEEIRFMPFEDPWRIVTVYVDKQNK